MGNRERLAEALGSRLHEHLECGDIAAFDADLAYRTQVIQPATQPFFLHTNALFHAARSIMAGDFVQGERLAHQALQAGQRIDTGNAASAYGMQMATIRREQGRLAVLAPLVQHFVQQNPASAAWLPGLALIYSDLGWQRDARDVLAQLAVDDFGAIARDAFWVSTLAYLSEVCAALHDTARAAILYPLLLPYRERTVVVGLATVCYGAAARYLGLLAATLARWDDAERHFEDALALNARLGARPWLAHTQADFAAMLLARGCPADQPRSRALLDAASMTAAELGMRALADKCAASRET
jgi:tetratricopeptide (TPR) repeat protein